MINPIYRIYKFTLDNILLISILIVVSICIMVNSYFDGYLISSDSANYLRAAREISRGNGFYVYPDWFAVWPIGYPFLIAVIAFITRVEVYLASRILSVIIVWLIGFLFYKRFRRSAWVYALVMLNYGFLNIFYFAWSESVFILGLLLLSLAVSDIITADNIKASHYIKLTFAVLLLFLSRYVGAFGLVFICLLWIWSIFLLKSKQPKHAAKIVIARKRFAYLTFSGIFSTVFVLGYLLINRMMSGYMTGLPRIPSGDFKALLLILFTNQGSEMINVFRTFFDINNYALVIALWFLFAAFIIRTVYKNFNRIKMREKDVITPLIFILIGGFYWCAIVAMRFTSAIDDFNYRLIFPSSFLLFIGFIGFLGKNRGNPGKMVSLLAAGLIIIAVLTAEVFTPRSIAPHNYTGYNMMKGILLERYAHVPDGALVIEGDIKLIYMRENVRIITTGLNNIDIEGISAGHEGNTGIYVNLANEKLRELFEQYQVDSERIVRVR